jgi:hypothetical protein
MGAFVPGIRVLDEVPGFLGGWKSADDIQVNAPDKYGIGTKGGVDAQRGQLGQDEFVNLAHRHGSVGAFKDVRCRHLRERSASRGRREGSRQN